jgi:hypothetical protein
MSQGGALAQEQLREPRKMGVEGIECLNSMGNSFAFLVRNR